jgi:hypothetical protein
VASGFADIFTPSHLNQNYKNLPHILAMEQPTKKQKTSNGAAPGIGNAPSPAPQPQHNKKSNPDFELPVASIVRLVKRVRLLFGNHLKKKIYARSSWSATKNNAIPTIVGPRTTVRC